MRKDREIPEGIGFKLLSNKYKAYSGKSEDDHFIALEWELSIDANTKKLRNVRDYLVSLGILSNNDVSITKIRNAIIKVYQEEFDIEFCLDAGGIEIKLPPMTLDVFKHSFVKDTIEKLIEQNKTFNLIGTSQQAGIHANINYSLLGSNLPDRGETVAKMAQFLYNNIDFMIDISGRKGASTKLVDMYAFLNDAFAEKPKEQLEEDFLYSKRLLKNYFFQDVEVPHFSIFNLTLGKESRTALELRWFASTDDYYGLACVYQFAHAFAIFCNKFQYKEMYLENFCKFVEANKIDYIHLYDNLLQIPQSASILNNGHQETIASR